ncbi:hypothetical protein GBB84_19820 [Citrobacter sp. NMI7905_11]|uniref:Uncharacterized protein n=1 Tax=Citrobacter telavivensis TaxID=2653932 RepID=A0A6L5EDC2_9ENTR|nr:hypothetical protein [Citrobacter telavivensis]
MSPDGKTASACLDAGIFRLNDLCETCRLTCCDLLQSSGKKQNIPSMLDCHLFSGLKTPSREPRSHIIMIS